MNRKAFKLRMQELKSYRELNPDKGYLEFKSYKDGGEVGDKPKTEPPYSSVYKGTRLNPYTGLPLAMGQAKPFLDLEDAANLTPLGDAITVKDMGQAAVRNDWKGLGWASLGLLPFVPPVTKKLRKANGPFKDAVLIKGDSEKIRRLSTVDRKAIFDMMDRISELKKRESLRFADDFYLKNEADANNARNLLIESLSEDKKYYKRAKEVDDINGTDYVGTYDRIRDLYKNNPEQLPGVRMDADLKAEGRIEAILDGMEAFEVNIEGRKPLASDYLIIINPEETSTKAVLDHEMSHMTDAMLNKKLDMDYRDNPFLNRSLHNSKFKDHAQYLHEYPWATIDEGRYWYLTSTTEEKAFINAARTDMAHKGIIKKRTQDPTKKQLRTYLDLPDVDPSIVKLSKLYKDSASGMYKAMKKMPYLASSGLSAYHAMKILKEVYDENQNL